MRYFRMVLRITLCGLGTFCAWNFPVITLRAQSVNQLSLEESGFFGREQEFVAPLADEYTTVRILPDVRTDLRHREQSQLGGTRRLDYFIRDWVPPTGVEPEAGREHRLIFKPDILEYPLPKTDRGGSLSFAADQPNRTLLECIQRAIEASLPLEIATHQQVASKKKIRQALRELFPNLELEYTDSKGSNSSGFFKGESWRINSRQPIFHGGVLFNKLKEEKENLEASLHEYDQTLNDTIFDVSEAYITIVRAEETLKERRDLFQEAELWRAVTIQKVEKELISEVERLNVESIYHEQLAQVEIELQNVALAQLDLQRLLNLETVDEIQVAPLYNLAKLSDDEVFIESLSPSVLMREEHERAKAIEDYVELAYKNRSELKLNTHRVRANQYAERAARGTWLPQLDFILEVGQLFEVASHIDPVTKFGSFSDEKEYRVGMEMDWNVAGNTLSFDRTSTRNAPSLTSFNAQGTEGTSRRESSFSLAILDNLDAFVEAEEAKIDMKEAIHDLEEAEREVLGDVKRAYYDYQKSRVELISYIRRLDYRERLGELAKIRLDKNEIQVSEYLQSRIDLGQDRIQMHRVLTDFFLSKARLNRAVGVRQLVAVEDLYV